MSLITRYLHRMHAGTLGIATFLLMFLTLASSIFLFYFQAKASLERVLRDEVAHFVLMCSCVIDVESHYTALTPEVPSERQLPVLLRELLLHNTSIQRIFTISEVNGQWTIALDSDSHIGSVKGLSDSDARFLENLSRSPFRSIRVPGNHTVVSEFPKNPEYASRIVAIAPLETRIPRPQAFIGVEYDTAQFSKRLVPLNFAAAVSLVVGIFLSLLLSRMAIDLRKLSLRQIDERKRFAEAMKLAKESAEQARDAKTEFLAIAAHDLKNPLSAIIGISQLIQMKLGKEPILNDRAGLEGLSNRIQSTTQTLLHIVENLLSAAAIERSGILLNKSTVEVGELIMESIRMNQTGSNRKGVSLNASIAEGIFCSGDRLRLFEAFDNLINNAVKYAPSGTTVWVKLEHSEGNKALFSVEDEGPGISKDDLPRLFGRFEKLSAKPTGGESSTGLGLSIVKAVIDAHDARVWYQDRLPKGSRFCIEIQAMTQRPEEPLHTVGDERGLVENEALPVGERNKH